MEPGRNPLEDEDDEGQALRPSTLILSMGQFSYVYVNLCAIKCPAQTFQYPMKSSLPGL